VSNDAETFATDKVSQTALVVVHGSGVKALQYVEIDGRARVEGCIDIGSVATVKKQTEQLRGNSDAVRSKAFDVRGSGIKELRYRWTDKTVPYTIADSLQNRGRVTAAIEAWRAAVPRIKFVERTQEIDYVTFTPGSGCSSSVGMQGGQQFVTLGDACTTGNCIHEIGHTLGLWHEQSRIDRDLYIRILMENILPGMEHNFYQHIDDGIDLGKYDYGSIMHYPADAFSKNGKPTIQTVREVAIGQRDRLTPGDIEAIEALYPQ
jgi:Astacin (Peptidase family M12A)